MNKPSMISGSAKCPVHAKNLMFEKDNEGLWNCRCPIAACSKIGYGWEQADAYLDWHKANNVRNDSGA